MVCRRHWTGWLMALEAAVSSHGQVTPNTAARIWLIYTFAKLSSHTTGVEIALGTHPQYIVCIVSTIPALFLFA